MSSESGRARQPSLILSLSSALVLERQPAQVTEGFGFSIGFGVGLGFGNLVLVLALVLGFALVLVLLWF